MKRTKELTTNKGITLIALVITIIVMLVLVGVTISMAINGGLFEQAGKAGSKTNEALKSEEELSKGKIQIGDEVYNSIDEYLNKDKDKDKVETISKETDYLGKYADVDGDGAADGMIYADLAFSRDEVWGEHSYSYEAVPAEELKDYYVNGTHNGPFGNGIEVLTAVESEELKDRFYVMALEDIDGQQYGTVYSWYLSKDSEGIELTTSEDFGTGKTNTATMIGIWNADTDEAKSSNDLWANIQTQVNDGWFVPSIKEWIAFCGCCVDAADDTHSESIGLSDCYWSSTGGGAAALAWCIITSYPIVEEGMFESCHQIRLSITF